MLQAEEKDFKTAYSYFYEAFEGFSNLTDMLKSTATRQAILALKYMLLCKVMLNKPEEVTTVLNNKIVLKFPGPHVEVGTRHGDLKSVAD